MRGKENEHNIETETQYFFLPAQRLPLLLLFCVFSKKSFVHQRVIPEEEKRETVDH